MRDEKETGKMVFQFETQHLVVMWIPNTTNIS